MRRAVFASTAVVAFATALLAGCIPEAPPEASTPPAVSSSAPPVTSEPSPSPEDPLLTEAREVYQRYLDERLAILQRGEVTEEAFAETANDEYAALARADIEVSLARKLVIVGRVLVGQSEVFEETSDALTIATCIDNSGADRVVDGQSQPSKPAAPLLIQFETRPELKISGHGPIPEGREIEC